MPIARPRRTAGFSLLEAIVAVGVIGVLLTLTVPGLRLARRAAGETASLANLGQIAVDVEHFLVTHDGEYPQMKPYVRYQTDFGATQPLTSGVASSLPFSTFLYWPGVIASGPEFDANVWRWVSPGRDLNAEFAENGTTFRTSYLYSHTFVASPRLWTTDAQSVAHSHTDRLTIPVRQSMVAHPSSKAMFFDWDITYWGTAKRLRRLVYGVFDVPIPILFADGHAAAHKPSDATPPFRCPIDVQHADMVWMNTPSGALGADH